MYINYLGYQEYGTRSAQGAFNGKRNFNRN